MAQPQRTHLSVQEMRVGSLGREDPLEKETATHSSILAWEIHGRESLAGYRPWGHKTVGYDLVSKQQEKRRERGRKEKGKDERAAFHPGI